MGDTKNADNHEPQLPFVLPKHLINELNEHAVGGFALFFFNPETGYPQNFLTFDSPAHCLAMQKYINDWCMALQDIYIEGTKEAIRESTGIQEGPDSEEDVE